MLRQDDEQPTIKATCQTCGDLFMATQGGEGRCCDCMAPSEESMEELLALAIDEFAEDSGFNDIHVRTFEDAGVLTRNRGLVVSIDGAKFQLTIVRV